MESQAFAKWLHHELILRFIEKKKMKEHTNLELKMKVKRGCHVIT